LIVARSSVDKKSQAILAIVMCPASFQACVVAGKKKNNEHKPNNNKNRVMGTVSENRKIARG
jgi:hypothetical protein